MLRLFFPACIIVTSSSVSIAFRTACLILSPDCPIASTSRYWLHNFSGFNLFTCESPNIFTFKFFRYFLHQWMLFSFADAGFVWSYLQTLVVLLVGVFLHSLVLHG